ncbi:MAG: MFS transporter [Promethearchaeota archaeon]|nr:MAG: MFS transporter [Candidatus Lokiarchaeota archaeon]
MNEQEKFKLSLTFSLSLGFFANQLAWTLFDAQVPITLFQYLGSYGLVGFWMAVDTLIAIILIPIMGSVSDNTRTKYGRRMPYIMVGIPISAIFFVLISTINPNADPLWLLLIYMLCFYVVMMSFRAQTIALMPDFTKPVHRNKAYSIFNLMAGIGTLLASVLNFILVPISLIIAFLTIAILMIFCLIIMMLTIKEKEAYVYQQILEMEKKRGELAKREEGPFQGLVESLKYIAKSEDKSAIAILFGIFLWFCGYYALSSLFSVYAVEVLGMERGPAGSMIFFSSLPFLLMTVPAGIIATKVGRILPIKIGLTLYAIGMIIGFLFQTITIIIIGFIIAGIGFAFVNTLAVVILWELVPTEKRTGTFTGIYFFAIFSGATVGPITAGFIMDLLGSATLLLIVALFFIGGLICMFFVKRGEAGDMEAILDIDK